MKRMRFLLPVFIACGIFITTMSLPTMARPPIDEELAGIREEISLLNLLRGFYLSPAQLDTFIELSRQAKALRDKGRNDFEASRTPILKSFANLRDALFLPPGKEKEAQDAASEIEKRLKEGVGQAQDGIAALEEKGAGVLSSAQNSILDDFKPCLIPPKDLRNPMRVGQAGAELGILGKLTDLIHAAPDDIWQTRGDGLLTRISDRLEEESGEMSPAMREDIRNRLGTIAKEIRGLNPVDFALKREKIAQELLLINPKKALKHGHKKTGQIARFLLSDTAVELLPRWKKGLANMPSLASGSTDLECSEEADLETEMRKKGEQALKHLTRMHNERRGYGGLADLASFLAPVQKAIANGNQRDMLFALTAAADKLTAAGTGKDLTNLWKRVVQLTNRVVDLQLLNRMQDPFGFAAEFKAAQDETNPDRACFKLQALAQNMQRFLH
ncbi:MAG: hypothetical protein WA705_08995 [Candidatus Ozemobacteraceae bacterium]